MGAKKRGSKAQECASKRVLFADDDPKLAQLVTAVLRGNGYEVVHVSNGREALAAAATDKPDLVILDIVMPVLDGVETAMALQRDPSTSDIPLVALTATPGQSSDAEEDAGGPWAARLKKPVKVRELVKVVGRLTGRPDIAPKIDWSQLTSSLWSDKYAAQTRGRVEAELAQLGREVAGPPSRAALESLRVVAHQLSGSAPTFGYVQVGDIARELENRVVALRDQETTSSENELDYLRSRLQEILTLLPAAQESATDENSVSDVATAPATAAPLAAAAANGPKVVLVLHDDPEYAFALTRCGDSAGIRVESFDSREALTARATEVDGGLAIIGGAHASDGEYQAVRQLHGTAPELPIFVLSHEDTTTSRVAAIRAGANRYLQASREPAVVLEACREFLANARTHGGKVVILDDDPAVLSLVEPTLTANGCEVYCQSDPSTIFERLGAMHPDVLICDVDMPAINGIELTRALRASEQWAGLPIIVMSRYTDFEKRAEAYAAGADEFLSKPIVAEELVMRVTSRLEREAFGRAAVERDLLTGLLNRKTFFQEGAALLDRARDEDRTVSLAVVEVENLTSFIQSHGLEASDTALKAVGEYLDGTFAVSSALTGRIAGAVFAVLDIDTTVDELAARIEIGLAPLEREKRLAPDGRIPDILCVSADVIASGSEGLLGELINRAVSVRRRRPRVSVRKIADGRVQQNAKVYVIDDDQILCEMLEYSLSRAGFEVEVFGSGDEGLAALLEARHDGSRPVVLLDVDLPRLDGMSVLRQLEKECPGRYQVMLITAHGASASRIEGLRSSAIDYVVKPVDVHLVIEKIRKLTNGERLVA